MSVASDRSCIQSNGTLKNELSAEDVLDCCEVCGNCLTGGDPLKALAYWALEGNKKLIFLVIKFYFRRCFWGS